MFSFTVVVLNCTRDSRVGKVLTIIISSYYKTTISRTYIPIQFKISCHQQKPNPSIQTAIRFVTIETSVSSVNVCCCANCVGDQLFCGCGFPLTIFQPDLADPTIFPANNRIRVFAPHTKLPLNNQLHSFSDTDRFSSLLFSTSICPKRTCLLVLSVLAALVAGVDVSSQQSNGQKPQAVQKVTDSSSSSSDSDGAVGKAIIAGLDKAQNKRGAPVIPTTIVGTPQHAYINQPVAAAGSLAGASVGQVAYTSYGHPHFHNQAGAISGSATLNAGGHQQHLVQQSGAAAVAAPQVMFVYAFVSLRCLLGV
uniref:Uncharacterized protein n=1 Tax=Aedes aegypti TaxID=7159 RepID=A0A6E8P847_AEDAE